MTKRETELQLVEHIFDGVDVKGNMERLYLSLQPLFHKAIHKYGRECEREDLMQEMYFALVTAVEQYTDPKVREKYAFHRVLMSNVNHRITVYLLRYYRQYVDENGKVRAYSSPDNALSLNVRAGEDDEFVLQDLILDDTDVAAEIERRETEEEQREAAAVLWDEVDKMSPSLRDAIVDYYRLGISHAEKAKATGLKRENLAAQTQRGLKKLRNNPRIQEIAPAYIPSVAYIGGSGFFKNTGMSSTEYVALKNIEREERGAMSTYQIRSPSFFEGKPSASVARCTGVSESTVNKLRKGNYGVYRRIAEKIARFYGIPFDELFEICVERAAPPGNPAKDWRFPKSFRLADPDFFKDYHRSKIDREKSGKLNVSVDVIDGAVKRLRNGGRANTNMAKRLAFLFDVPFESLFVPV